MKMSIKKILAAGAVILSSAIILCSCTVVRGDISDDIQLNQFFGNHMVLARNKKVAVFGTGRDGVLVEVEFNGQIKQTTVENGSWKIYLDEMPANCEGQNLYVRANGRTKILSDVLVGEVWFCSGQSNMFYPVGEYGDRMYEEFIPDADNPLIRVGNVLNMDWTVSSVENIDEQPAYSAAFSQRLQELTGVPVGVIVRSVGGTAIVYFLEGSVVYNTYIKPVMPFTFNGILWYQGENDTTHTDTYEGYYTQLVELYRKGFEAPDLPFIATQLANYKLDGEQERQWSEMRLVQLDCLDAVENSYLVCQLESTRDAENIHPDNKKSLGIRAADIVGECLLGIDGVYGTAPRFEKAEKTENGILVTFSGVNTGLSLKEGDTVSEFRLCEADGVFYEADAKIVSPNQVLVISSEPASVTGVSYCDISVPHINMYDGENPVFNFRYFFE